MLGARRPRPPERAQQAQSGVSPSGRRSKWELRSSAMATPTQILSVRQWRLTVLNHVPHFSRERLRGERFFQKPDLFFGDLGPEDGVILVT